MKNNKVSYGELNDLNLKGLIALSRCTQTVHKKANRIIKEGGLTTAQFAVLEVLYHKGNLRIREIMEKILSTGGNMTVVIDNLEKDDMVRRSPDPEDRRATLISITEKGKKKIEEVFPRHLEDLKNTFNVLSQEEKNILIVLLKKLGGI